MKVVSTVLGRIYRRSYLVLGLLLMMLFIAQPSYALTDYMFFSVNGDTSASAMVQGDSVAWGSNCAIGADMSWEIWLDIDTDGIIDSASDRQIVFFIATDGDTEGHQGLPDINPIPDGWYSTPPMLLGIAAAQYIFRVTDMTDDSNVSRAITSSPLSSPPNAFRGRITIEGHPAPDPVYLQNIWIEANIEDNGNQIWSGLTDANGDYQINVGSAGNGLEFRIEPMDIPGFLPTPSSITRTASGVIDSINFAFMAPSDSIYGEIRDQDGALLTIPIYVHCYSNSGGSDGKDVQAINGSYAIYFAPTEFGIWNIGLSGENIIPDYLIPMDYQFDNTVNHTQRHDFICQAADTVIYARITEQGNYPSHQYMVFAQSNALQATTYAISETGPANTVPLSISSLDTEGWYVSIGNWDDNYPIPPGYVLEGNQSWNNHPGDTVALNFVFGVMVRDTIKVDAGDSPVDWSSVWVNLNADGSNYGDSPDDNGVFTIYADTGVYWMGVNAYGYLSDPSSHTIHVTGDTTGGMGFTLNEAHCRIAGTLVNVPLPLTYSPYIFAHTGNPPDGYQTWGIADSLTGNFSFYACDGNWTIEPPMIQDRIAPSPPTLIIAEYPDSARTIELVYVNQTGANDPNGSLPAEFTLLQNYPNPFNSETVIEYNVPRDSRVAIEIYSILGERVLTLVDRENSAGVYRISWDGSDDTGNRVSSGIYFYRMQAGAYTQSRKMVILK